MLKFAVLRISFFIAVLWFPYGNCNETNGVISAKLDFPSYALKNSNVRIACLHGLEDQLVSKLIWYKDDKQFFRYVAEEKPQTSLKKVTFFQTEMKSPEKGEIYLRNLSLEASGRYRCEVSKQGSTNYRMGAKNFTVIELPVRAAEVIGVNSIYSEGEMIDANCSTVVSEGAILALRWKINHQYANSSTVLNHPVESSYNKTKLVIVNIKLIASKNLYKKGILKLECEATIPGIFQKSSYISIRDKNYQEPFALEQKPRATRVRRGIDVSVIIPEYAERSLMVELKCLYKLQEASLYSVKWYKESKQFYSYIPGKKKPKSTFDLPHLQVDLKASKEGNVVLSNLSMDASGQYKCEVITEAPHFYTKFGEGNMTVIDLPESAPVISGLRANYQLGEEVLVNCSSLFSRPAASLNWFINDIVVNDSHWLIYYPITIDQRALETAVLGLQFIANRDHFTGGTMRLKCKAQIGNLYYQSQENVVLDSNYMQRKQEQNGYYPLLFYNSCSTFGAGSSLLLCSFFILLVNFF